MGTKAHPSEFDCYAAVAPDEPLFVLRALDPIAPILVRAWADERERRGMKEEDSSHATAKVDEARQIASAMELWRGRGLPGRDGAPQARSNEEIRRAMDYVQDMQATRDVEKKPQS
jgi:hypothetical protein